MKLLVFLVIQVAVTVQRGLGAVQFVDPPSGSVIANFEGTENVATLMCNVTFMGIQAQTRWGIEDFRGVPGLQNILENFDSSLFLVSGDIDPADGFMLRNQLTILRLTSELDGTTLYCGTGASPQQANFFLRLYRPPNLRDNVTFRIVENSLNIPIDLSQNPAAFPEPTTYTWTRNGAVLSGPPPTLTYSTVIFPSVSRNDAGNYAVSITNFDLNNSTVPIGSDMGSFSLDVIYGPTFAESSPLQRYALLNDSLSLVCGTGLDSNPQATITWIAPDGTTVMDNARYDLQNGPEIVRLNFAHTILGDTGTWRCDIRVISSQNIVSNGALVSQDPTVIGTPIVRDIQLTIFATPGQPRNVAVDSVETTSVRICWEAPFVSDLPISFYSISARNLNATGGMADIVVRNTTTNSTFFNVIGLLPGITYELTVVAVSQGGDIIAKSQASESVQFTTIVTVPALLCDTPTSTNGVITVTWSYIHTGGLPLTNVSVTYASNEDSESVTVNRVPISGIDTTSIEVSNLVTGFEYTFDITADNRIGSTSVLCGPTLHRVGRPATPIFGELISGPGAGEVTIMVKTVASGLDDPSQVFWFVVTPYTDSTEGETIPHLIPNYQSGTFVTIIVRNLEQGESYRFNATATNTFGVSEVSTSNFITAGVGLSVNIGSIVGGVVGGLSALLILTLLAILLIVMVLRVLKKRGKVVITNDETEPEYEVPDFPPQQLRKDLDIELTECPAYSRI